MKKLYTTFCSLSILCWFNSCSKDRSTETIKDKVNIAITTVAGEQPFVLGDNYMNAHGDTFSVRAYKYYISNIELIGANGAHYMEDYSYHLVDVKKLASMNFVLNDVPEGTYTELKVMLGVDSLHNVSGAQTGDLDPQLGMFWEWNSGYIMAKIDGNSPQADNFSQLLSIHLGGFSGEYSSVRTVSFSLPQALIVKQNDSRTIHLQSDILKWFTGNVNIDFQTYHTISAADKLSKNIVENYKHHLTVLRVD